MKAALGLALAALLAQPVLAAQYVVPQTAQLLRDMPADIADFITRADSCVHWMGEPAWDPQRAADIRRTLDELRCEKLREEQKQLAARYVAEEKVLQVLRIVEEEYLP
jgi:hypothetical protein